MIYLAANWKMHGSHQRVASYSYRLSALMSAAPATISTIFCPPAIYLETARRALPLNSRVALGGQNCAKDDEGAFTGGISAPMLRDAGASYVILGHSERRQYMYETDSQVELKAEAAHRNGLTPIICVGETEAEYSEGKTRDVLNCQLKNLGPAIEKGALVAYEPVWAIGTGKTPTLDEIGAAHSHIKSVLGSTVPVLYGGSVKPANIGEILNIPQVHGALIGGASLEIESMQAMVATALKKGMK